MRQITLKHLTRFHEGKEFLKRGKGGGDFHGSRVLPASWGFSYEYCWQLRNGGTQEATTL